MLALLLDTLLRIVKKEKTTWGTSVDWNLCDWELLIERMPSLGSHQPSDDLILVASHLDAELTLVFVSPPLLRGLVASEYWQRLGNQRWLKLSGDGVYKTMREGFVLLNCGLLVKKVSDGHDKRQNFWSTTYLEMATAIAVSESETTYTRFFVALADAMRVICRCDDFLQRIAQMHGDQCLGLEAARRRMMPRSIRCVDWSHFAGCTRPKASMIGVDDCTLSWRRGFVKTLQKTIRDPELLDTVRTLVAKGENDVVATFKKYYIQWLEAGYEASWRGSIDRCQPGSFSGTQSQEIWHKTRLRASLRHIRRPVDEVIEGLENLFSSRLQQARLREGKMHDFPHGQWSPNLRETCDKMLTYGDLVVEEEDAATGAKFFCFRSETEDWTKPSPDILSALRRLFYASPGEDVQDLLLRLPGLEAEADVVSVAHHLSRFVLTVYTPRASGLWRLPDDCYEGMTAAHTRVMCWNCHQFGVGGACVHSYAAMRLSGASMSFLLETKFHFAFVSVRGRDLPKETPWQEPQRPGKRKRRGKGVTSSPRPASGFSQVTHEQDEEDEVRAVAPAAQPSASGAESSASPVHRLLQQCCIALGVLYALCLRASRKCCN
eukprot:s1470_g11.t1